MNKSIIIGFAVLLQVCGIEISAQEVQWRGPNRDGIYHDTMLLKEWPEDGPELLFVSRGISRGFSSAVATEKQIFVTGILDGQEYLTAMDLQGNIQWQKPHGPAWDQSYPEKFDLISSFRVREGTGAHWARPTKYNSMLLVRHGDVLLAYDIKL